MRTHLLKLILVIFLSFFTHLAFAQFENCNNGVDDDNDGLVDCFDDNCASSPFCRDVETDCADGLDNDGDGLPDCLDTDCTYSGACPVETDCNNGIDDDGDGFFDYYDGDCINDPTNPNSYITSIADCEVRPQGNVFDIEVEWQSETSSSGVYAVPTVADLDQDGIPEIIATNERDRTITILSGSDGSTINSTSLSSNIFAYPATADVDGDGFGEIFVFTHDGNLWAFNHDLTPFWSGSRSAPIDDPRMPNIADFNQDGVPEVYYVNEIRNAQTGQLIVRGSHNQGSRNRQWDDQISGVSVAVDILPDAACTDCEGLELVLGNIIYSVNIPGGAITEVMNMDDAMHKTLVNPMNGFTYSNVDSYRAKIAQFGSQNFSFTSVVDLNEDGHLDVVLSGTINNPRSGPSMIFFWDLHNSRVTARLITRPYNLIPGRIRNTYRDVNGGNCGSADGECTWRRGMGTLNIASIDADPELEITFMSGSSLYALDHQLNEEWANHNDFWETSSGFTGTTVFDFNGDGSSEVVYRDEIDLYIIDGTTGIPLNSQVSGTFCSSQTQAEYPVVADVDGDGETEIVVSCGCYENTRNLLRTNSTRSCGFIRTYKAANNNYWVPSRKLWNQFSYFNVNINDDLTIPRFQQGHHIGFAQKCSLLGAGSGFSLNKFLNQSPVINYCGNLTFPSPNLEFADNPVRVNPPTCPEEAFQVRLRFINTGDETAYRDLPISFYADDPTRSYTDSQSNPHLETLYLQVAGGIQVGEVIDTVLTVNGRPGEFELFISLNDIGPYDQQGTSLSNSAFYPLDSLNGVIRECDNTPTIVSALVEPYPFNTTSVLLADNDYCPGSFNSNGAITAHVGGDTTGYIFRWYRGSNTSGALAFTGATQRGLDGGTYTVSAHHTLANCTGNPATVTVRDLTAPPIIDAEVVAEQTSCDAANPNGILRGYVLESGQQVTAGYNFFWYRGQNSAVPARTGYSGGAVADQLSAGTYRLVVEHAATGCTSSMDVVLRENITYPNLSLDSQQDLTICDPANYDGGAEVSVNGNTSGYDFYWYSGQVSSPDTTSSSVIARGSTASGLADGRYTVFAAEQTTRCLSAPLDIRIRDNTWQPVVNATVVNPNEACDPALANGSLQAVVDESSRGGSSSVSSGYTFEWYAGTFTAASLPTASDASGSTVNGLTEGSYTLLTTSVSTGCQTISHINLPAQRVSPVIDTNIAITHADNCTDPWGSRIEVSADGGMTAADGYTFRWRNLDSGTTLAETSHVLSNIPPGRYGVAVTSPLACTSLNEEEIIIRDEAHKPQVNLETVANTSCEPAQYNGMLIAHSFSGTAADYTFEWFYNNPGGSPVESSRINSSGDTLRLLPAGTYALRLTDNSSLCTSVTYATISNGSGGAPLLDTLYTQATTDCRPAFANGEVSFHLPNGASQLPPDFVEDRTYTFELYSGGSVSGSPLQSNSTGTFTGLNEGAYTAIVRDDYNHCVSAPLTIDIDKAPGVSISVDTFTPSSACASSDGSLGIVATSVNNAQPSGAGYTFQWYYRQAGDPLPGTADPGTLDTEDGFSSARIDLPSGIYLVEVYDNFSHCLETFEFFLPNADPPEINSSDIIHASQCSPGNGSIEIDVTSPSITLADYDVILYQSPTVDPASTVETWNPPASNNASYRFDDLSPGDYTIAFVERFGAGCFSTIEYFSVPNATPEANISFSTTADYSCNSSGFGSVSVSGVSRNGNPESLSGFSYEWYAGQSTSGSSIGSGITLSGLSSGYYTVVVTDTDGSGLGCSYSESIYLDNVPRVLAVSNVAAVPNTLCSGTNGEISITELTENGNPVAPGNYTFSLLDDSFAAVNPANYSGSGQPADPFSGLAEGTYYIQAENNHTGCTVVSPATWIITETSQPQVSLISDFPDFSCSGGIPTGALRVSASSPADGDTTNFSFNWYDAGGNSIGSGRFVSGLTAGQYTLELTDTDGNSLGCNRRAVFEVLPGQRDILLSPEGTDPTFCDPANGQIYVDAISESYSFRGNTVSNTTDPADYVLSLLDDEMNPLTNSGSGTAADPFNGLEEGLYYVQAQNINTDNCVSVPVSLILESLCMPPVVAVNMDSPQYSQNPDPATWTGSISVDVTESPDNPVDSASNNFSYTFEWYHAEDYSGGSATPIGTGPSISGLDSGTYVVVVRNNVTGAVSTVTYTLPSVRIEPVLLASGFPQTTCLSDGSILLDSLGFNGAADDPGKYTVFLFEDESLANLRDSVTVTQPGDTLFTGLSSGAYYLQARHDDYLTFSQVFEVTVNDLSTEPIISPDIDRWYPQISCQPDILATGQLAVSLSEADGSVDTYRYQWYRGNAVLTDNILAGENETSIDSLRSGFYTVEVFNERTQCAASQTFFVEEQIELPLVEAASEPATVCDPALADGIVRAEVTQAGAYTFAWYAGNSAAGLPDHRGATWGGLMPGTYTVVATDLRTGTCLSEPVSIQVEDVSQPMPLEIEVISQDLSCDPALANGVLGAVVSTTLSDYRFAWYDESDSLLAEGSANLGELSPGDYRLEATYLPTGCVSEAWGTIINEPNEYPEPTVSISSHMLNCAQPDGSATAMMGDDSEGFVFYWYDSLGEALPEEQLLINEDDLSVIAGGLVAGTYFVEAYDLSTGCYSPRAEVLIEDEAYVPDHQVLAEPASCELNDGSLKAIPEGNMTISRIDWTHVSTGRVYETNYQLEEALAGDYEYTIYWANGCSSYGTAFLSADINVFNGISPNGDGENDYFHIDCINQFPDNEVKIFNRAGALVYEAVGYDNMEVLFNGQGNRGLYIGGRDLPDGTYFYVIKKNDGSKDKTGYLEISR